MIKAVITPITVFTVALFLTLGACLNWIALVIQILILKRASFVIGEDGLGVPWYEAPPSCGSPTSCVSQEPQPAAPSALGCS